MRLEPPVRPVEILLVEDSAADRLLTRSALASLPVAYTVHEVPDGVEAMAFLRREGAHAFAPRPDLVLLDLNLPRLDGREVLATVKADPVLRLIPVLVLTTSETDEDVVRAYGHYANGYVAKPVERGALETALRSAGQYWFEVSTRPDPSTLDELEAVGPGPGPTGAGGAPVRVLLLEDAEADALLLERALGTSPGRPFQVHRARRLSEARRLLEAQRFDVVLADLGLPDVQGLDTVRAVRSVGRGAPIIVPTGLDDDRTGHAALEEGAVDYLVKGADARTLARSIRYTLDRREIQEQLARSQRLDALGQLAGGVAHDFNNLLTVIKVNANLLTTIDDPQERRELVDEIRAVSERGAALTRQLLAFSRKQVMDARPLDLNALVDASSRMLRRVLGAVRIELRLGEGLPPVHADAGMLEQVLVNLALNARDAMGGQGTLTLETRVDAEGGVGGTPAVVLAVADTGAGIAAEHLDRIWDPFFTTKPGGKGTGLGLTTVHGIVGLHRGRVAVRSAPGEGSVFEVFLAKSSEPLPPSPSAPHVRRPGPKPAAGQLVLVVDDERAIRTLARRILTAEGHQVLEAASGDEALAVWAQHRDAIDLVVTDLTMPEGLSGAALAKALRARGATMPIIFCSGYSDDVGREGLDLRPGVNFLPKPYGPEALAELVARTLASR